jgi:hypothetical protein
MRTYGDIAAAVFLYYGEQISASMRKFVALFQVILMGFNVAIIILGTAQGLRQMIAPINTTVCFLILSAAFTIFGALLGQILFLDPLCLFNHVLLTEYMYLRGRYK